MENSELWSRIYIFWKFLTKIVRLIEIKDAERISERHPTSNQAADEMISTLDYLPKIRSFVNSGRDILKDI